MTLPDPKPRQPFAELINEWFGVGMERAQQIADEVSAEVRRMNPEDDYKRSTT